MKITITLLALVGLTGCAHKDWCPTAQKAEAARMDEQNKMDNQEMAMTDEVDTSQSAAAMEMSEPVEVDSATIRQIQSKLNSLGMQSGPVDGIKGPITTSALKRFQTSENLDVDGDIDRGTLSALDISEDTERFAE